MTAEQLSQLLDQLSQKLTPAGQHVFELAVRNQIISGIIEILVGIVLTVSTLILFRACKYSKKLLDGCNSYSDAELPAMLGVVGYGLLTVFSAIIAMFLFSVAISQLLNPEWYALKDIMSSLTGK